jgi:hypothetical protein
LNILAARLKPKAPLDRQTKARENVREPARSGFGASRRLWVRNLVVWHVSFVVEAKPKARFYL